MIDRLLARLGADAFLVAWSTPEQVVTRAFSLDGKPLPGARERRIHVSAAGEQSNGRFATRDDGAVAVFLSPDASGKFATVRSRAFAADGKPAGPDAPLSAWADGSHARPAIAALSGGYVAAWSSEDQDGSGEGVYARLLDVKGGAAAPPFGLATLTKGAQSEVAMAPAADGGFLALWTHQPGGSNGADVVARRFDAQGTPAGPEASVPATNAGNQGRPAITAQPSGTFVAAWHTPDQDGSGLGVYVRRLNSAGTALTGEAQANAFWAGNQRNPVIAAADDKGVLACWESYGQDSPSSFSVWCRLLDAKTLVPLADAFSPHLPNDNHQTDVAVAARPGGYAVAWVSGNEYGVQVQRYDASVKAVGYQEQGHRAPGQSWTQPFLALDAQALWIGWRRLPVGASQGATDIVFRRLSPDQ